MFCLVAITYTSPKVSVTASKRVERERERRRGGGGGVLGVLNVKYVSNQLNILIF